MSSTRNLGCGLVPTFFSGFVGKPMNTCWLVVWNIFYCSYIGNVIIPTDVHSLIFQRGRYTTDQERIEAANVPESAKDSPWLETSVERRTSPINSAEWKARNQRKINVSRIPE
jgi:hypothetical protein